jgi:galactokinase
MSILGPEPAIPLARAGLPADVSASLAARVARLVVYLGGDRDHGRGCRSWFVPGRIEVLGKHTDYAGGRSIVCAVERGLLVVARARGDDLLSITDVGRSSSIVLSARDTDVPLHWAVYPFTVWRRLTANFGPLRGADIAFESDLPSAAGLSSSSALMVGVLLALTRVNDLETTTAWRENIGGVEDLAAYAATIENGSSFGALRGERGVGTEGGSQDHTAILCSRAGQLTQFSYRPTRLERSVALPPPLTFVIGVSGVRAQKTGAARDLYNRAAQAVGTLMETWRAAGGTEPTLADVVASSPDATRLRTLVADRPALVNRLDQFVEESTTLVPAALDCLAAGDLGGLGTVVDRSQEIAGRWLGNQVPETVELARLARAHGAVAASAFGAGFGGSVWALVEAAGAPAFIEKWENAYRTAHPGPGVRAAFLTTRPGPPAFAVQLET